MKKREKNNNRKKEVKSTKRKEKRRKKREIEAYENETKKDRNKRKTLKGIASVIW